MRTRARHALAQGAVADICTCMHMYIDACTYISSIYIYISIYAYVHMYDSAYGFLYIYIYIYPPPRLARVRVGLLWVMSFPFLLLYILYCMFFDWEVQFGSYSDYNRGPPPLTLSTWSSFLGSKTGSVLDTVLDRFLNVFGITLGDQNRSQIDLGTSIWQLNWLLHRRPNEKTPRR